MIPLIKLCEIAAFAVHNKFNVTFEPDEDSNNVDLRISYGRRDLIYKASSDEILLEDIMYDGNFDNFEAELNLLNVFLKIGNMIKDAMKEGC